MTTAFSKHQTFAHEYVLDHNAKQAAIRAGYSEQTAKQQGSRLLTYVDVQDEIAVLERARREVEEIDRAYVLAGLRKLAETAESESARVRSLELLGKTMRMFVDVKETSHTLEIPELTGVPLDELLELREAMKA